MPEKVATALARGNRMTHSRRRALIGYIFLLPFLVHFAIFIVYPFFYTAILSFSNGDIINGIQFVGLKNYMAIAQDAVFRTAMKNNLIFLLVEICFYITLSLGIAVLLNRKLLGIGGLRTAFYIPVVMDWIIVALIWKFVLDKDFGVINAILKNMGLRTVPFLTSPDTALYTVIGISVWKSVGYYTIFYLAALQDVPQELVEAGKIDGANAWQAFWRITMPQISHITVFVIIIGSINALKIFDPVYVLTSGGPLNTTTTIMYLFYKVSFVYSNYGQGASIAIAFTIGVAFFIVLQRLLMRRLSMDD